MANTNWENLPSTNTPINATNLNKISASIVNIGTSVDSSYNTNLITTNNLNTENYIIGTAWNNSTGINARATAYVPIKPNTKYYIRVSDISGLTGSTPIYIRGKSNASDDVGSNANISITANGDYTLTTTNTDNILAIQFMVASGTITTSDYAKVMLTENSYQDYKPFVVKEMYVDNAKFTETIGIGTGVNGTNRVNVLHSKNLLDYNTSVNGVFTVNSTSETLDANNTAITSAWIPCEPNTTYRLYNPNGTSARQRWQTKASNGTITYMGETNTLTTNSTAKYMRVYYYVGSTATSPSSITNVQIEKGSEFTGFEPYITPSIVVDNDEIYSKLFVQRGEVAWNATNVSGSSTGKKWYKIGNIVIVSFEFTPLSGKIANGNVICTGLPAPQSNFYFSDNGRQFFISTSGNVAWYYPTNTSDLTRVDMTFVYVVE